MLSSEGKAVLICILLIGPLLIAAKAASDDEPPIAPDVARPQALLDREQSRLSHAAALRSLPLGLPNPLIDIFVGGQHHAWVEQVPFPADIDSDGLTDGLLSVGLSPLVYPYPLTIEVATCVNLDFTIGNLHGYRQTGEPIAIATSDTSIELLADALPQKVTLCERRFDDGGASVSIQTQMVPAGSGFSLIVSRSMAVFEVEATSWPGNLNMTLTFPDLERRVLQYDSDTVISWQLAYLDSATQVGAIVADAPQTFTAGVKLSKSAGEDFVDLGYTGSSSFSEISLFLRSLATATRVLLDVGPVPTSGLDHIESAAGTLVFGHDADNRIARLSAEVDSPTSTLLVDLTSIPAHFHLERGQSPGAIPSISYHAEQPGASAALQFVNAKDQVSVAVLDLPTSLTATAGPVVGLEDQRFAIDTQGSGAIYSLEFRLFSPTLLKGVPGNLFSAQFRGLRYVDLRQIPFGRGPCSGCMLWENADVDAMVFQHGDVALNLSALHVSIINWRTDICVKPTLAECDMDTGRTPNWVAVHWELEPNTMVYERRSAPHARAVLW